MTRFLYDTAVFIFALGAASPYREPCQGIVDMASRGDLTGEASVDLLQELAHQRFRKTGDRSAAIEAARRAGQLCELHELRLEDLLRGLAVYETCDRLSARDSVYAAVALNRGIDAILTPDRGFDQVEGLERIDPADEAAVAALAVR